MSVSGRFRHLERPRTEEPEKAPESAVGERFGQIDGDASTTETPSALTSSRFENPAVSGQNATPELAEATEDQPFIRCCRCEGDNQAHASACIHCGSSLETLEQRTYNDRFWAQRLEERRREAEAHAAFEKERAVQAALEVENRRIYGENLAREVAERYREEQGFGSTELGSISLGRRLLAFLPEAWRTRVLAGIVGIPVLLVLFAPRGSTPAFAGFVSLFALAVLFTPPALWRRRGRGFWRDE